jgi:hypothetical protein
MKLGFIGYPNSGKTTLFNAAADTHAATGFGAKAENIAQIAVPDERLRKLHTLHPDSKLIFTQLELHDYPGFVHNPALDKRQLNAILGNVRQLDALALVIRCFADAAVPHPDNSINPVRDWENVELDLYLADLQTIENRLERLSKDVAHKKDPAQLREYDVVQKVKSHLDLEKPVRELDLDKEEWKLLRSYALLSEKPQLVVLNYGEGQSASDFVGLPEKIASYSNKKGCAVFETSAQIEAELAELEGAELAEMLEAYNIPEPVSGRLIRAAYKLCGLISFFTFGPKETRAWTVEHGATAVDCAAAIHNDLAKNFVRAEVMKLEDLLTHGSEHALKEKGLLRLEKREYVVEDGEIVHIRHTG